MDLPLAAGMAVARLRPLVYNEGSVTQELIEIRLVFANVIHSHPDRAAVADVLAATSGLAAALSRLRKARVVNTPSPS